MKKYISFIFLVLALISSCTDSKYDGIIDDTAYLANSDLQQKTITLMKVEDYVYEIWIHKGGFFQNKFEGSITTDNEYLIAYNASKETDYEMLNEKYYSFEKNFVIAEGVNETPVPLTLKTNSVLEDLGYGTYYIPLAISSPSQNIFDEKSNLLLALTLKQPVLSIDGDNKGEVFIDFADDPAETHELDMNSVLDIETTENLEITYSIDPDMVLEGENILDPQYYTITKNVTMPEGEQTAANKLTIKLAQMPRGRWIIPVRLSTPNTKVKVANDAYLKLTVVKGTLDDIQWGGDFLQVNEIIVSSDALGETLIATAQGVEADLSVDADWIDAYGKEGNVYITIPQANTIGNLERVATVTILDKGTQLEKSIKVRQGMHGYGIGLNKKLWSIAEFSSNTANKQAHFTRLFDSFWPANKAQSTNSYIELGNRTNPSDPYIFTFDLGEEHISYNSFGIMPRLQWTEPSAKRVKIEVSDDLINWTVLGPNATTNGMWDAFTREQLNNGTTSYDDKYYGIVCWFDLGNQNKRYIRLSTYESYRTTGINICMDEVFVNKR